MTIRVRKKNYALLYVARFTCLSVREIKKKKKHNNFPTNFIILRGKTLYREKSSYNIILFREVGIITTLRRIRALTTTHRRRDEK